MLLSKVTVALWKSLYFGPDRVGAYVLAAALATIRLVQVDSQRISQPDLARCEQVRQWADDVPLDGPLQLPSPIFPVGSFAQQVSPCRRSYALRDVDMSPSNFPIVRPNSKGTAPADMKEVFKSPTRCAWVLGQTQANGPGDFAPTNAVPASYKLTPLSAWGKPYTPPANVPVDSSVDTKTTPRDQVAAMDVGTFFNQLPISTSLPMVMKDNPPAPEDGPVLAETEGPWHRARQAVRHQQDGPCDRTWPAKSSQERSDQHARRRHQDEERQTMRPARGSHTWDWAKISPSIQPPTWTATGSRLTARTPHKSSPLGGSERHCAQRNNR